ncbi:hypothetical protein ATCC90586_011930 [Pythium insidiosum]|nr:hypothetical protein ATCC90586_011930 [Pythium insidiosum]
MKLLAQRYKASCTTADAAWKEFRDASEKEVRTEAELFTVGIQAIERLSALTDLTDSAFQKAWATHIWRAVFLLVKTGVELRARKQRSNIASSLGEIATLATQISEQVAGQSRLRTVVEKLKDAAKNLETAGNELTANGVSEKLWALHNDLLKASVAPDKVTEFATEMNKCFQLIRRATLADVSGDLGYIITVTCDALQELRDSGSYFAAGDAASALAFCYSSRNSIQELHALLLDSAGNIDRMRDNFGK